MKCIETQSTQIAAIQSAVKRQNRTASFAKVLDGRKQPIRGLWKRNGRFYAQLKVENAITAIRLGQTGGTGNVAAR